MPILSSIITAEELDASGWREVVNNDSVLKWTDAHARLSRAWHGAEPGTVTRDLFPLLDCAISMHLQPRMSGRFKPRQRKGNTSTGDLHNLGSADVDCLLTIAPEVGPAWARAHLADVALEAGRLNGISPRRAAGIAVPAYLDACSVAPDPWYILTQLQRGLELAWQFSREDVFPKLWSCLEAGLLTAVETLHLGNAFGLVEEIHARKRESSLHLGTLFESLAAKLSESGRGDAYAISRCFDIAAMSWAAIKQPTDANRNRIAAGNVFCERAELPGLSSALAAEWLSDGIARLQKARETPKRIRELKERLSEFRGRISDEMKEVFYPFDGTDLAAHVEETVSSNQPFAALVQVAFATWPLPSFDMVRKRLMEDSVGGLLDHVHSVAYNENGEPVDAREPLTDGGEERIYTEMVTSLGRWWPHVTGNVVAVVSSEVYNNRFSPPLHFLMQVVRQSSAVPEGHHLSIAKGILAGFNGEWHEVGAFLIPQVEGMIRTILQKRGAVTLTERQEDRTTSEKTVDVLLQEHGAALLGKDLTLVLDMLMTHRAGCKLRHLYAHGMLTDDEMSSTAVAALWWVVLRIVLGPFLPQQRSELENVET